MQIQNLPQETTVNSTDKVLIQSADGVTRYITVANLLAGLSSSGSIPTTFNATYAFDGDANGILYYLGTAKGQQAWSNPNNISIVISASSIGLGTVSLLSDRQDNEFYTGNNPGSWVEVSLLSGKLQCNYYSLRNRNQPLHFLRNWKLQGSNDNGNNWDDLDNQVNNISLNSPSQWLSLPVTTSVAYSQFRILETDINSSGAYYICLGEIELYGIFTQ